MEKDVVYGGEFADDTDYAQTITITAGVRVCGSSAPRFFYRCE
jgi:hypothetical protein